MERGNRSLRMLRDLTFFFSAFFAFLAQVVGRLRINGQA
jgi:hypothetical protein